MTTFTGPSSVLIQYAGRPAALVGIRRLSFLGDVRHRPPGDPVVRVVCLMAYYAQLVLGGEMAGPYTDEEAERFARLALIDERELARHCGESNDALANRFRVPVEQVAQARKEFGERHGR